MLRVMWAATPNIPLQPAFVAQFIVTYMIVLVCAVTGNIPKGPRKCYSCASEDYEVLWNPQNSQRHSKPRPAKFNQYCDSHHLTRTPPSLMSRPCRNVSLPCLTIMEERYMAGVRDLERPYLFVRGCADELLANQQRSKTYPTNRPAEVDYLLSNEHCEMIPTSEIWPFATDDTSVMVCSCAADLCNAIAHDYLSGVNTAPNTRHIGYSLRTMAFVVHIIILWVHR